MLQALLSPAGAPWAIWFFALLAACGALYWRNMQTPTVQTSAEFKAFQTTFLVVYYTMFMADWMQGPYVYALYDKYGFSKAAIGQLFIMGFGASMLFGTIVGGFADKFGRKNNCLLFVALYSIGCITKHFNNYWVLMFGRLMGGISTSILYSAFETWMVHEHKSSGFADEWISGTFAAMSFGSGAVAILAGLVSSGLAATIGFVAPFDGSMLLLLGGGAVMASSWKENYGGSDRTTSGWENFGKAWTLITTSERVLLLGIIQSCFESAMYIFVFMWTPALESAIRHSTPVGSEPSAGLPHGVVFAGFMVCTMIGSKLFELLVVVRPVEHGMRWVFVVASAALAMPILTTNSSLLLLGFCVFEVCCGIYWPGSGTMRSKYIQEEVRSTVMNIFRIGLNAIVVLVLINIDALSTDTVFLLCTMLLTVATLSQHRLFVLSEQNHSQVERQKAGLEQGEEMDEMLKTKEDVSQ